jgi:N-acetylmuramate 1-kinase
VISPFTQTRILDGEAATIGLGEELSLWARPGMLILLNGDLGAGKSTLARAFIRTLMKADAATDIPSPTFSLIQTYEDTRVPVFHADLYRLQNATEVDELGLDGLLPTHAGLIEWPDRLSRTLTNDCLVVSLDGRGTQRSVMLQASGAWAQALERNEALKNFLVSTPHATSQRIFFEGDASSRRYEKLVAADGSDCLLMDMPQRPDGPVVKYGKPYSQIAHLAENIASVVAINTHLVGLGYSAPEVLQSDLSRGVGLIEPLGANVYGRMMLDGTDMQEPLEEAAAVLADMATKDWPRQVEAAPGVVHTLHDYDEVAQLIEADLLPSWFIPHARNVEATAEQAQEFASIWQKLLPFAQPDKPQWTIRDYHSPNLLWIPSRLGIKRVGIIDSQDAVIGHPAYDLMSMAQDARVDVSPNLQDHIVSHYCTLRKAQGNLNIEDFKTACAVLGAQRATKILGIFARLNKRDGKPAYLKHMPRVSGYLQRNLEHKALAPLKVWFNTHAPEAISAKAS